MWVIVIIVIIIVDVLFAVLMFGRDAFKTDAGSKKDTHWGPHGI